MKTLWRLSELVELVSRVLMDTGEYAGASKRVRWKPTVRVARYYTTIGLLDRPTEMRGRTGYYGMRHLLQLVAIKKLQLAGLSLEQVQHRLTGLPDDMLREISELPDDWSVEDIPSIMEPVETAQHRILSAPRDIPFWQQRPSLLKEEKPLSAKIFDDILPEAMSLEPYIYGLDLKPGVTLLLDRHTLSKLDRDELRAALEPLLDYLSALDD